MMVKRYGTGAILLAVVILLTGLLASCTGDGDEENRQKIAELRAELQAQVQQLEEQLNARGGFEAERQSRDVERKPTLIVKPLIFKFPERRLSTVGDIWFMGSGLEPGQWFSITIDTEGSETTVGFDMERAANEHGVFALGTPGVRPERFLGAQFEQRGGVFIVKLWDTETGALLASTPWAVCGLDRANEWCEAAVATALVPEPVVEGAGTIYNIARIRIQDGLFQLRMGADAYWGYEAEARIDSTSGDGWVMTIKLGDTIKLDRLEDRGTVNHNFTIAELGIDIAMTPDQRIEPFELKPDKVGEFVIDDSSDPGAHGKALLIVTE